MRRFLVTWTRRFADGQHHRREDVILAKTPKRAALVIARLYGGLSDFHILKVAPTRNVRYPRLRPRRKRGE